LVAAFSEEREVEEVDHHNQSINQPHTLVVAFAENREEEDHHNQSIN
jgi:hypothetical protein